MGCSGLPSRLHCSPMLAFLSYVCVSIEQLVVGLKVGLKVGRSEGRAAQDCAVSGLRGAA